MVVWAEDRSLGRVEKVAKDLVGKAMAYKVEKGCVVGNVVVEKVEMAGNNTDCTYTKALSKHLARCMGFCFPSKIYLMCRKNT
jgi:ribosomal protein L13